MTDFSNFRSEVHVNIVEEEPNCCHKIICHCLSLLMQAAGLFLFPKIAYESFLNPRIDLSEKYWAITFALLIFLITFFCTACCIWDLIRPCCKSKKENEENSEIGSANQNSIEDDFFTETSVA